MSPSAGGLEDVANITSLVRRGRRRNMMVSGEVRKEGRRCVNGEVGKNGDWKERKKTRRL